MQCPTTKQKCTHLAFCDNTGKCLEAEASKTLWPKEDMSASQPNPTPQELTAPTLEQLAKDAAMEKLMNDMAFFIYKSSERYNKLRKLVKATSINDELCFVLDVDWGAIPCGDDGKMLDAAIDMLTNKPTSAPAET